MGFRTEMLTKPRSFTCSHSAVGEHRIVQKQQTALRQGGRDFVRRLGDQIGPVFSPYGQRRTEVKVRCMRGIHHDRNRSRVCPFNDGGDIPNDPEVIGRGEEHTIDALATEKLVESAQRRAGRESESTWYSGVR